MIVTFRFAADKVVPKRERAKAHFNEVAPGQRQGSPESSVGKESTCNARRPLFDSWVGKTHWRRDRLPTPVFWPRKFHGLYSPWVGKESDTTEQLN